MEFFNSEKYGFVSYSHKDSKKVVPIVQRMSAMGYRIWYDEALPYLEDYNEVIGNALNDSSVFIVFLTRNSVESKYVRSEIYRACDLGKPVCAVMLEKCELPQGLALRLAETNQIRRQDFSDEETFFSCICSVVEKTGCRGYVQTTPQTVAQSAVKSTETKPQEAVSPLRKDWKQIVATVIKWILAVAAINLLSKPAFSGYEGGVSVFKDILWNGIFIIAAYVLCTAITSGSKAYKWICGVTAAVTVLLMFMSGNVFILGYFGIIAIAVVYKVFTQQKKPFYWITFAEIIVAGIVFVLVVENIELRASWMALFAVAVFIIIALQYTFLNKDRSPAAIFERLMVIQIIAVFVSAMCIAVLMREHSLCMWIGIAGAVVLLAEYFVYRMLKNDESKLRFLTAAQVVICAAIAAETLLSSVINTVSYLNSEEYLNNI